MLSREQKAIIRRICKLQLEDLNDIRENLIFKIYNELIDDEYDITINDIYQEIDRQMGLWIKVKYHPDRFFHILFEIRNEHNYSMIKHHLIQEFEGEPPTRGIWQKIEFYDNTIKTAKLNVN
jgi:hypothetical protein